MSREKIYIYIYIDVVKYQMHSKVKVELTFILEERRGRLILLALWPTISSLARRCHLCVTTRHPLFEVRSGQTQMLLNLSRLLCSFCNRNDNNISLRVSTYLFRSKL